MFRKDLYSENNNESADSPSTTTTTTTDNTNTTTGQQQAQQQDKRRNKFFMIHPTTLSMLSKMYNKNHHHHHHHCLCSSSLHHHQKTNIRRSSSSINNSHTVATTTTTTTKRHSISISPSFRPPTTIRKPSVLTKHNSFMLRAGPPPTPLPNSVIHASHQLPPINFETLKELSAHHIFKSLQLRHDLLFDPHLSFRPNLDGLCGREKKKRSEKYWRQLDHNLKLGQFDCLKGVLSELSKILTSLINPFDGSPASGTSFVWMWPPQVTRQHVKEALDEDWMIQQLRNGGDLNLDWLIVIFEHLLSQTAGSQHHQLRLEMMKQYFSEKRFAKALKQCFYILELIKLDCANRVITHYRTYLLETCAEFEYRCFIKQLQKDQITVLNSISSWFKQSASLAPFQQINKLDHFKSVYYTGLIHHVVSDSPTSLMTTLQFDQKRLTTNFRYEFQNLVVLSILIVPYRSIAGKVASQNDMASLKQHYTQLFKNEQSTSTTNWCQIAATHACQLALSKHNLSLQQDKVQFWNNWLIQHLKPTSSIFELMSDRFAKQLVYFVQYGKVRAAEEENADVTMDEQVELLGKKIKLVADLNLEIFGAVYKSIFSSLF